MKILYGSGQILEAIDDIRERALAGKIEGLVICWADDERTTWHGVVWKENAEYMWPRLVATVTAAQNDLIVNGLVSCVKK